MCPWKAYKNYRFFSKVIQKYKIVTPNYILVNYFFKLNIIINYK